MHLKWVSKTNVKGIVAKMVILVAVSIAALSQLMPVTGAKMRSSSSEREASLMRIMLEPSKPLIFGAHLVQTLIVTGKYSDGSLRDLTRQATFRSSNPAVATVDSNGTVKAIKNGMGWIT